MTNTLLKLRKKIPEHIRSILMTVFGISDKFEIKAFVVGATARDLIFEYVYDAKIYRATEDIDFGVAVGSWKEYELLKKALIETKKFWNAILKMSKESGCRERRSQPVLDLLQII